MINGQIILYDGKNDKYIRINSNSVYSGKTSNSINTFEYSGAWTSFAPGFSIYGPPVPSNSTTKATTKLTTRATTKLTTRATTKPTTIKIIG